MNESLCECGKPVWVKKTAECKSCYHKRYYQEHKPVVVDRTLPPLPSGLAEVVEIELYAALREHRAEKARAYSASVRESNPEYIARSKALYRRRKRDEIRGRDAAYRKSEHGYAKRLTYTLSHREETRQRAAAYEATHKAEIAARKKARYWALKVEA